MLCIVSQKWEDGLICLKNAFVSATVGEKQLFELENNLIIFFHVSLI